MVVNHWEEYIGYASALGSGIDTVGYNYFGSEYLIVQSPRPDSLSAGVPSRGFKQSGIVKVITSITEYLSIMISISVSECETCS